MAAVTVENEDSETPILPAEPGPGGMDRAESPVVAEPEKRAGHRMQSGNILQSEQVCLVRVEGYRPFLSISREPDPVGIRTGLFFDPDDIPHVTAAFPALLTPEDHVRFAFAVIVRIGCKTALRWRKNTESSFEVSLSGSCISHGTFIRTVLLSCSKWGWGVGGTPHPTMT